MASRSEDRKLQLARITVLAIFIALLFLVLLGRLWYLQIALGDELMQASEANRIKLLRTRGPRGTVLDRKGRVIATSRPQFVVLVIPEVLSEHREAKDTLCRILNITDEELEARLETSIKKGDARPGAPVRVETDVPLATVARIGEMRMYLPGVSVELDNLRDYPDGSAVAHVMGYIGEIDEEQLAQAEEEGKNYRPGDYVGKAGLEREYEDWLKGTDGGKQIEVNALGRVVRILGEKRSVSGKTLKLTIDRDLQIAAQHALGGQTGAVVAVEVNSGKVLTMACNPAYDPNIFVKRIKRSDWEKITREKALQNRTVYNVYPPGSTFKPIMAIAGLVYNECDEHTTVTCPGSFYFGRRFGCWKVHGSGIDFERAIAESCDVWFYKLALRLGIDRMAKVAKEFGISKATGIDLPFESRYKDNHVGTMPSTKWKKERFKSNPEQQKWYPGETPSCGIGQGYVQVSPLQLALAIGAVANKGKVYRPYLLEEVIDRNGKILKRTKPEVKRKVNASPENFELVRQAMRATVTKGTGRVCNMPDVTVAGKTGSAETNGPAHAWFVCFAPVEKPEIAIACIVEHGRHGATAAAPVCRAILDVYFGKRKVEDVGQQNASVSGD